MRKIYVPIKGAFDYSDASRFGELVYLSEGRQDPFNVQEFSTTCKEAMQGNCEDDYILLSGLTSYNMVAIAVFIGKLPPICNKVSLLIHKGGEYVREQFIFR